MVVFQSNVQLKRTHETDIIDITSDLEQVVARSGISKGLLSIFVAGSTGAIITLEYEPGLLKDIPALLDRIAPKSIEYLHEKTWHDDNGHSHVRASLLGPSLTVPISHGQIIHGTWQQIAFLELDTKPRNRNLYVTVIGEE
ncbi:MAG: secondary thiamine-phosphate synthase enzyme YjbQ [Candidatus Hodarchaeota archaeon]